MSVRLDAQSCDNLSRNSVHCRSYQTTASALRCELSKYLVAILQALLSFFAQDMNEDSRIQRQTCQLLAANVVPDILSDGSFPPVMSRPPDFCSGFPNGFYAKVAWSRPRIPCRPRSGLPSPARPASRYQTLDCHQQTRTTNVHLQATHTELVL